ncbi:MAG: DUF3501 family protein [Rhodospirillales bacterium]|nr:DUF3501 family protein [Rhodospirillales bacterium]MBO6787533.1 DUF3501 family protein [Rhodospirillales bacterium]
MLRTEITRADIVPIEEYAKTRKERRTAVTAMKRDRRVACGPDATFYFENYDTMWHQVHEMLYIEKGGEEQIADELAAYNPLIPNGRELVATLMFEIEDEGRRKVFLSGLGGVEETITLEFEGETIKGVPEDDVDRTTADGKASSVQFIHFPFTDEQAAKLKATDGRVVLGINHPKYGHLAVLSEETRAALAGDLA